MASSRRSRNPMDVKLRFELFRDRSEELRHTRILQSGFNPGVTMHGRCLDGVEGPWELSFESYEPDADDLRSCVTVFRPFILQDEPVHLFSIYNLCHQHLTHEQFKTSLAKSREVFARECKSSGVILKLNEQEMTPERVSDLWINGYYFHIDEEQVLFLRSLPPVEQMLVKNQFLFFLVGAITQVLYVGNIIHTSLTEGYFRIP